MLSFYDMFGPLSDSELLVHTKKAVDGFNSIIEEYVSKNKPYFFIFDTTKNQYKMKNGDYSEYVIFNSDGTVSENMECFLMSDTVIPEKDDNIEFHDMAHAVSTEGDIFMKQYLNSTPTYGGIH